MDKVVRPWQRINMSREELKRSGLLDQYVLGLLSPERSAEIEQMMEEDPFIEMEVKRLRAEMNSYADARNIAAPPSGRRPRSPEEFQDLDHEMITAMMEHNHTLNIWRYVLVAVCFLLICLSGYLFRLKENYRADLVKERALHAQDDITHELDLKKQRQLLDEAALHWDQLHSQFAEVEAGDIRIHYLTDRDIALVDLSGLRAPETGAAYFVFDSAKKDGQPSATVTAEHLEELFPVTLSSDTSNLLIYTWRMGGRPGDPIPLAMIDLP